jgi:SPP1 gp7 family putative phage head morphogenesis protein
MIVKGLAPDGALKNAASLITSLTNYAKLIEPWAESVAKLMLADVARRDAVMWKKTGADMSKQLRRELAQAPTGAIFSSLQAQQVTLIKSLPLEAAKRVHDLSMTSMLESTRASYVAKQILATESVTKAKATLIARTEVSRATSNLVQARATYAGSDGYIWRTSGDYDVRDSHADMEGKYVRWGSPPKLDGLVGHAGTLPNCRCFAEPIFPDD